jgi:hypothetical protein
MTVAQQPRRAEDGVIDNRRLGSGRECTMSLAHDGSEMLTAQQVREITGVPVSTLHDWAAKRERGIDAPGPHHFASAAVIGGGQSRMSRLGWRPRAYEPRFGQ